MTEIDPTSAISSVSPTPASPAASHLRTSRWTVSGWKIRPRGGRERVPRGRNRRPRTTKAETIGARTALRPAISAGRSDAATCAKVLLLEAAQLHLVGEGSRELRHAEIEKQEAPFDRVPHQHPIALGVEKVTVEESHDLEVLRLAKGRQPLEAVGQALADPLERVAVSRRAVDDVLLEQPQRAVFQ